MFKHSQYFFLITSCMSCLKKKIFIPLPEWSFWNGFGHARLLLQITLHLTHYSEDNTNPSGWPTSPFQGGSTCPSRMSSTSAVSCAPPSVPCSGQPDVTGPVPSLRRCSGSAYWASLHPTPGSSYFPNQLKYKGISGSVVSHVDRPLPAGPSCYPLVLSAQGAPRHLSRQYSRFWARA